MSARTPSATRLTTSPEENAKLRAEAAALRERVKALEDVISEAAPLAWVAHQDMDGASAWEKRAHALINPGADDKRASTREP